MDLNIEAETLISCANIYNLPDNRVSKKLLAKLMNYDVPGYCAHIEILLKKFGEMIKRKTIKLQGENIESGWNTAKF